MPDRTETTSHLESANYLLIDGVLTPDAYETVRHAQGVEYLLALYQGTRWAYMHGSGPLLVKLYPESGLREQVLSGPDAWSRRGSLFFSPAPFHEVARHLRRFLAPPLARGGQCILRFADPLITRYWLNSCTDEQLDAVLGPIEMWHVRIQPHTWLASMPLQWQTVQRGSMPGPWEDAFAVLGDAQLALIRQADRWRFIEELYTFLDWVYPELLASQDQDGLGSWFEARLVEAEAWGLTSDRSLALWVEYSLRCGDDVIRRLWAETPELYGLAPEVRIQKMDSDWLAIELAKEA